MQVASIPVTRCHSEQEPSTYSARRKSRVRGAEFRESLRTHAQTAYREAILASAERLMSQDGHQIVKVTDIAAAAGISVGTLYNYFGCKEELLVSLFERQKAHFRHQLDQPYESCCPLDQLRQLVERVLSLVAVERERLQLLLRLATKGSTQRNGPEEHQRARPQWLRITELLGLDDMVTTLIQRGVRENKLRADVSAEILVLVFQVTLESATVKLYERHGLSWSELQHQICALFVDGAAGR